ncbi:hypothetical protein N7457_005345 [Penicillium paradoxum]|uniref:uncharacterized protein n=1 Tax=Penicillium paradoxum TaxID=176176 RepID=UPI0025491C95|nr:uncharacterized protein N7457_005345 [Penicillium paradoxum]KAJ5780185.1 hypothetical protein N7457_005345 [Penicillium paradoxum]
MQLTAILPIVLAGLSAALPQPATLQSNTITDDIIWSVSNFTIGCSQGGCTFAYDIVGRENSQTPKFRTHCSGIEKQKVKCDDEHITTTVSPAGNPVWKVEVIHSWKSWLTDASLATWWQQGEKDVTVPDRNPVRFVMKPTQEYGIA